LIGLPWEIIHPVCRIADASRVHPAAVLGAAAAYTGDRGVRQAITQQLTHHGHTPPPGTGPNRATRRAQTRNSRRAAR
jgi:hypothetical protein